MAATDPVETGSRMRLGFYYEIEDSIYNFHCFISLGGLLVAVLDSNISIHSVFFSDSSIQECSGPCRHFSQGKQVSRLHATI
uniref:Uncharacterized protein n=1 Tax=Helianthus annuus TaxID=4232 RepID=A0A251UJ49_HELAN